MANFKTHVGFSTATGLVYGTGIWFFGIPAPTCALAGGMCALAGMLPDVDSKSSRSLQECLYLAAGLSTMLLIGRLREFPINDEIVLVLGGLNFLFVRFVFGYFVRRWTVHRGLLHSIPAALAAGGVAFFLSGGHTSFRAIKAVGLILGYLSHLTLDEIYSVDVRGVRLKKSFGTALKFFDFKKIERSIFLYAILVGIVYLLAYEPDWSESLKRKTGDWASVGTSALVRYSEQTYEENPQNELWDLGFAWFWYGDPLMAGLLYPEEFSGEFSREGEFFDEMEPGRPIEERETVPNSWQTQSDFRNPQDVQNMRGAQDMQSVKPFFSHADSKRPFSIGYPEHGEEETFDDTNVVSPSRFGGRESDPHVSQAGPSQRPSPARSATSLFLSRNTTTRFAPPSPIPIVPKSNSGKTTAPNDSFDPYEIRPNR